MPKRLNIALDDDINEWVEAKIKDLTFHNHTHAIKVALTRLKDEMDNGSAASTPDVTTEKKRKK